MSVDLLLWIAAFVCFLISFVQGLMGAGTSRLDLISLGLALGALTFIV